MFVGVVRGPLASSHYPKVGEWMELGRRFDENAVRGFAELTGDMNPVHLDGPYFDGMDGPIVHGALVASLIPTTFATTFPGSIYRSQTLNYRVPVGVGRTVTAHIKVIRSVALRRDNVLLRCATTCVLRDGDVAVEGIAEVLIRTPATNLLNKQSATNA